MKYLIFLLITEFIQIEVSYSSDKDGSDSTIKKSEFVDNKPVDANIINLNEVVIIGYGTVTKIEICSPCTAIIIPKKIPGKIEMLNMIEALVVCNVAIPEPGTHKYQNSDSKRFF